MKYLVLLCSLLSALNLCAQADTIIKYWDVVKVDGASKDDLYQRARLWYNNSFKSSKDVLQIQDKETGELAGKGNFKTYYQYRLLGSNQKQFLLAHFAINLFVKEGKYKYEITNFELEPDPPYRDSYKTYTIPVLTSASEFPEKWPYASKKLVNQMWTEIKANVDTEVKSIVSTLIQAMGSKPATDF
jgi:hypothetical protein